MEGADPRDASTDNEFMRVAVTRTITTTTTIVEGVGNQANEAATHLLELDKVKAALKAASIEQEKVRTTLITAAQEQVELKAALKVLTEEVNEENSGRLRAEEEADLLRIKLEETANARLDLERLLKQEERQKEELKAHAAAEKLAWQRSEQEMQEAEAARLREERAKSHAALATLRMKLAVEHKRQEESLEKERRCNRR